MPKKKNVKYCVTCKQYVKKKECVKYPPFRGKKVCRCPRCLKPTDQLNYKVEIGIPSNLQRTVNTLY